MTIKPFKSDKDLTTFARSFFRDRVGTFRKDLRICLTADANRHHAYFPALIQDCRANLAFDTISPANPCDCTCRAHPPVRLAHEDNHLSRKSKIFLQPSHCGIQLMVEVTGCRHADADLQPV